MAKDTFNICAKYSVLQRTCACCVSCNIQKYASSHGGSFLWAQGGRIDNAITAWALSNRPPWLECSTAHHTFILFCIFVHLLFGSALLSFCITCPAAAGRCELTRVPTCVCVCVCVQTGGIRFQCFPVLAFTGEPRAPTLCLTNVKPTNHQMKYLWKKIRSMEELPF